MEQECPQRERKEIHKNKLYIQYQTTIKTVTETYIINKRFDTSSEEDLSELEKTGSLYQAGVDKQGRPVIVFIGKAGHFLAGRQAGHVG